MSAAPHCRIDVSAARSDLQTVKHHLEKNRDVETLPLLPLPCTRLASTAVKLGLRLG